MMEICTTLNRLFLQEPESRRRNLYLRTFAVVPLTEDCGLIEWVKNTMGFRYACCEIYAIEGKYDKSSTNRRVKSIYDEIGPETHPQNNPKDWLERVMQDFPPRMNRYFTARWPEPAAWLAARTAYTRTCAVWSMVGHVVGLGDRHGENLLMDNTCGDIVHVDFSCLFDKGLTLNRPEVVPFRLTQNVIDAMGPSGCDGAFRFTSETALKVLRKHQETLLSVAETFVYDPFVDWSGNALKRVQSKNNPGGGGQSTGKSSHHQQQQGGENNPGGGGGNASHHHNVDVQNVDNPMARDALRTMEGRLTGTLIGVDSTPSLPLSCEGQAHRLIVEATDRRKLGSMYIWWMPWF